MNIKAIIKKIEKKYPLSLAYDWDNVGLIVGDFESNIKKILVTLEVNENIVNEAINDNVDLIISHHPFIFKKINKINTGDLKGKLTYKLIKNNIALYSMHTNFDIASSGLNDYFMEIMGFEESTILDVTNIEKVYKLAVYVPKSHYERLRNTLCKSGAGNIGNYSYCSFSSCGEGTFLPLKGSNPYIGKQGEVEKVDEVKLETIVSASNLNSVIDKMLSEHPYEEVAYDLYLLENNGCKVGLGRVSNLKESTTLFELSNFIKEKLCMNHIRVVGDLNTKINKVAVVTGSGSDMIKKAQRSKAQVIITGDIKYHDAQDALDMGMTIIDCGHFESENIFKDVMHRFLEDINEVEVLKSKVNLNPFKII